MWSIKEKSTGLVEEKKFNTKHEAECHFEGEGGDYDYFEIIEVVED